jgi:2-polyprenyl-3-methyl-5-hydroxy-6-metoxy-1,4-benzoquinol methylase
VRFSSTYYDAHAAEFFDRTVQVDLADLRSRFTDLLAPGASILDAGCGSGRDSKAFAEAGFSVTAFDCSPPMVELAARYTGLPVQQLRFQDLRFEELFDGIWACASLLHVPIRDEVAVFKRLIRALSPLSGDVCDGDRRFM